MADFWCLLHSELGEPIETFLTREEAEHALQEVLDDAPQWTDVMHVEPFSFIELREER